ncbi:9098_t:CDS:1, partial [Scutellospora calospora]
RRQRRFTTDLPRPYEETKKKETSTFGNVLFIHQYTANRKTPKRSL